MFDKTKKSFPYKEKLNFLSHCSVSPMYAGAAASGSEFFRRQSESGLDMFTYYTGEKAIAPRFHAAFGSLLKTDSKNITATCSTAEGLNMIANGYPFEPGDEIISYIHEYPANHYPWKLQEKRGVVLKLLGDHDPLGSIPSGFAKAWSFDELETLVTERTRVIALSHVQFTSGYAADLKKLGAFCKERSIDLILDVAQSMGCLPVYPEEIGAAAVASAGWKWLLGPLGVGVLYTSPSFREKISITMSGADHMTQGSNYLDHTWSPFTDGRKFEYATLPAPAIEAISTSVEDLFLKQPMEEVFAEVLRLQDLAIEGLDRDKFQTIVFPRENRSGILSVVPLKRSGVEISKELLSQGILLSERSGYLRFAPHICTSEEDLLKAVELANAS